MISDEELLKEIQRLASGGKPPTQDDMKRDGKHSTTTFRRRFGSWNEALQTAGFEVNQVRKHGDEELLEEIRNLATDGKPPTREEMKEDGKYRPSIFYRRFGSWNEALQTAGFEVNAVGEYSEVHLLQVLREHTNGVQAPTANEFTKNAATSAQTISRKFGSWWRAVVRAGLIPQRRFPLSASQYPQFHQATVDQNRPKHSLAGLLLLFTGLPPAVISKVKQCWFDHLCDDRYDTVITVPNDYHNSAGPWTLKLPESYTIQETTRKTHLPRLTEWFFTDSPYSDRSFPGRRPIEMIPYRIAKETKISRRSITHNRFRTCPDIASSDLRASAGVQMARNSAPKRRIRRHLGIDHTKWDAEVEDFFLWLYIHEGELHPDYDPPDVILDPVDPNSSPE